MTFQNYLVKDGQAVPENPFKQSEKGSFTIVRVDEISQYAHFQTWKQSHTYQTDAKPGVYPKEQFVFVEIQNDDGSWYVFAKFKEDVETKKSMPNSTSLLQACRESLQGWKDELKRNGESLGQVNEYSYNIGWMNGYFEASSKNK